MIKNLFLSAERVPLFSWRSVFEHTGLLKGLFLRVSLVISSSLSVEVGLCAVDLVKRVFQLKRKTNLLTVALYFKQCWVSLQRHYAGSFDRHEVLSVPVSLTRSGLPRIIPKKICWKILRRDEEAYRLVLLYRYLFGLSKLIELAAKVSKATFKSITSPTEEVDSLKEVLGRIKESYPVLSARYFPWITSIPLNKGMRWEPTWKSTPMVESSFGKRPLLGLPSLLSFQRMRPHVIQRIFSRIWNMRSQPSLEILIKFIQFQKVYSLLVFYFIIGFYIHMIRWIPVSLILTWIGMRRV